MRRKLLRLCRPLVVALLILVPFISAAGYYVAQVAIARQETAALVSGAWRTYGAVVTSADLTAERRSWLLAIEDPSFYWHRGVDLATPGAGMTTITQGLVKLLYFPDGFQPGIGKIRQTLIAQYALDAILGKDEQLLLFMNAAYFGHRAGVAVHGFSNAAVTFFGKPYESLSDNEFVALVAMLARPNAFAPGTAAHSERVARVEAFLAGRVRPASVLDVEYTGKLEGSAAEEALMVVLRLLTSAADRRGVDGRFTGACAVSRPVSLA